MIILKLTTHPSSLSNPESGGKILAVLAPGMRFGQDFFEEEVNGAKTKTECGIFFTPDGGGLFGSRGSSGFRIVETLTQIEAQISAQQANGLN